MTRVSAFMITHNAIEKGEPFVESILQLKKYIDEIVVIDLWSNDGTDNILKQLPCKMMYSTLENPYKLFHTACHNELILMVDSNEVFDTVLLREMLDFVESDDKIKNIILPRIEVTYNFQKIAWNVHEAHRIFPRTIKNWQRRGVTTNKTHLKKMWKFGKEYGYLWACVNNFRDNWYNVAQHKELTYLPPDHYMSEISMTKEDIEDCKQDNLWKCSKTPLHIPDILVNLIGDVKYNPMKNLKRNF